jgi:hypothetical protein
MTTGLATADGVLEPNAAFEARDSLLVELAGNLQGACPADIKFKDAAHDDRLAEVAVDVERRVASMMGNDSDPLRPWRWL